MQKISVKDSTIYIGESYLNIDKYLPKKQIIIITDENLYRTYSSFVSSYEHIVIPAGESSKNWESLAFITEQLLAKGADRSTFLLGFGGGVITDITGFVASIFMRGIDFGFIASSLLAQVDASLGGKNGINFHQYKNMLGVFNVPQFVICDPKLLKTLPYKEVKSGFGEIIKHALIKDAHLFDILIQNAAQLLELKDDLLEDVIYQAIKIKATVVENDWKESGERKILNFGHTLGHAIEHKAKLTHGEAVAVGMHWAAKWSVAKGLLSIDDLSKITHLIEAFHLPLEHAIDSTEILALINKDKKKHGSAIDFVFLERIGQAKVQQVAIEELQAALNQ